MIPSDTEKLFEDCKITIQSGNRIFTAEASKVIISLENLESYNPWSVYSKRWKIEAELIETKNGTVGKITDKKMIKSRFNNLVNFLFG